MAESVDTPAPVAPTPEAAPPAPTPPPAEPASPPSSRDIVAATLEKLETADAEAQEDAEDEGVHAETPPVPDSQKVGPQRVLTLEEQLLDEFGFKEARRPDGREHRIPRSKVLQMIGSGLKRGQAKWEGEKTALEQTRQQLETHLEEVRAAVRGDPRAFLEEIARLDTRYQAFLAPVSRETPTPAVPADDPMPGPDLDLGNGMKTYSVQGLEARDAWKERQWMRKLEATVDGKLKPLTEREQRQQAEAEADAAARQRYHAEITEAQTWPGFGALPTDGSLTPFQQDVLDVLKQDTATAKAQRRRPTMTLRHAFLEVQAKHLAAAADPVAVRAQVLKDVSAAPRSTSVTPHAVESTRKPGPRSTREVVAETLAKLERGGA